METTTQRDYYSPAADVGIPYSSQRRKEKVRKEVKKERKKGRKKERKEGQERRVGWLA
jgi:hypothetical protein